MRPLNEKLKHLQEETFDNSKSHYIQWVYFVQLTSRIWAFIPDKIRQTEKSREGFEFSVKYG